MRSILNKLGCSYMVKRVAGFLFFQADPSDLDKMWELFSRSFVLEPWIFWGLSVIFEAILQKAKPAASGHIPTFRGATGGRSSPGTSPVDFQGVSGEMGADPAVWGPGSKYRPTNIQGLDAQRENRNNSSQQQVRTWKLTVERWVSFWGRQKAYFQGRTVSSREHSYTLDLPRYCTQDASNKYRFRSDSRA